MIGDGMWEMAGGGRGPRRAGGMVGGPQGAGGGGTDPGTLSRAGQSELAQLEQELEAAVGRLQQAMSSRPRNESEAAQLARTAEALKMKIEYLREKIAEIRTRLAEERERRGMGSSSSPSTGIGTDVSQHRRRQHPYLAAGSRWIDNLP